VGFAVPPADRVSTVPCAAATLRAPLVRSRQAGRVAQAPSPIDLLSVDVEGHELEVLSGFDFERWQPLLILVEDHVGTLQTHRYLKARGYRLIRRFGNNGWYVSAEAKVNASFSDRFEILRKYYLALPFRMLRNRWRRIRVLYADLWAGR